MPWSLFSSKPRQAYGEILKTYWTVFGPTRCPIRCALYRTRTGLELRTYRGAHNLLYFLPVLTENQGLDQATAWKQAMLAVAGFTEPRLMRAQSSTSASDRHNVFLRSTA